MYETRLLLDGIDEPNLNRIDVYERLGGYKALRKALTEMDQETILEELKNSGLRGRGGAGFSMGMKASFMPKGSIDKYLCCNADESEPGTFKDRLLIQKNPHRLIEGIIIAAVAAGANRAFIYIRGEYVLQADILERCRDRGLRARLPRREHPAARATPSSLVVHRGAGAYICGEETALLDSLEGKRGNPRLKPPFPANQGLYQGPTLINNVETLSQRAAHHRQRRRLVQVARHRAVAGHEGRVGVRQRAAARATTRSSSGIPARDIVYGLAGGPAAGPRRSSAGSRAARRRRCSCARTSTCPTTSSRWPQAGSMLGSGAIIVVDDSVPIVSVALRLAEFYRHESCGKCVPCREGTNWTVKMLERIDAGEAHADGPGHHGQRPDQHHRQLPLRARRLDGDAGRLDDQEVPRASSRRIWRRPANVRTA